MIYMIGKNYCALIISSSLYPIVEFDRSYQPLSLDYIRQSVKESGLLNIVESVL